MPRAAAAVKAEPEKDAVEDDAETPEPAKPAAAVKKSGKTEPKPSILSTASRLDEQYEYVNGLWMGDQGTGKTTDVLRLANLGPTIVISAEGGVKKGALRRMGVDVSNIQVLPAKPEDLTFQYLEDLYWELAAKFSEDPDYVSGVVWDSITEIHKVLLRNVVNYQIERAVRRGESRIKGAAPGDMLNQAFTDLSDYGIMTDQVRTLLRRYRDLPCHFAVTALQRRDVDDDGRVVYGPAVTPAVSNDLVGMVDVVIVKSIKEFADDGEDEYRGLTRPVGKFRGKDRFKVLPKYLVDPFADRVVAYINETTNVDDDEVMQAASARRAAIASRTNDAAAAEAAG